MFLYIGVATYMCMFVYVHTCGSVWQSRRQPIRKKELHSTGSLPQMPAMAQAGFCQSPEPKLHQGLCHPVGGGQNTGAVTTHSCNLHQEEGGMGARVRDRTNML